MADDEMTLLAKLRGVQTRLAAMEHPRNLDEKIVPAEFVRLSLEESRIGAELAALHRVQK